MGVFKLFEGPKAPPGEPSNAGGGSSTPPANPIPKKVTRNLSAKPFVVGGNLNKEGVPAVATEFKGEIVTEPTDALSPMAALRNSLSGIARVENLTEEKIKEIIISRSIARAEEDSKAADKSAARAKGKAEGEAEFENLVNVSLPALRESLIYWTGTPEVGEKVTLQTALRAIQTIEDGTKSKQDFAFNYAKSLYRGRIAKDKQTVPPGRVAHKLLNDPNLKDTFDELWTRVNNYDAKVLASRETATDMSELNALFAEAIGIDPSDISEAVDSGNKSEVAQAKLLANQARNRGKSLQATLEQVLREIKLPDPATGRTASALVLLNQHKDELIGENSYIDYPSTDVATASQLAQRYFNKPRRDGTFVLDRANGRTKADAERPNEREYNSIGKPISKILYRLKKNAEAISSKEDEGIESEPISIVLAEVQDELLSELSETIATAINRPLENDEVEKYLDPIVLKLSQDNVLNDIYDEALASYKKEASELQEARKRTAKNGMDEEDTWKTPDEFALLQRHFTAVLAHRLSIKEIIVELGGNDLDSLKLEFGGVERDPEVDAILRSEDTDRDLGAKRMKVEAFIQNLREFENITKQMCPNCTDEERAQMSLIAKAIYHYANEKRLERWDPTNTKADETGTTLKNYAAVFRTLSNRGLIEPLPAAHIAPPQAETESPEDYTLRLRKYFIYQDGLRTKAHNEFVKQQRAAIVTDLQALVTTLKTKDNLNNFLGTLGRILNKTGSALKADINSLIDEMNAEPERFIDKPPIEQLKGGEPYQIYIDGKLMQPKQETIDTLESLYARTESIQIAFDKLEAELKILIHRIQNEAETNPKELDITITNWFNNYKSQVIEQIEKLQTDEKLTAIIAHKDENLRRSSAYLYNAYFTVVEGNRRLLKQYQFDVRAKVPALTNAIENADIVNAALLKATESIEKLQDELHITSGALDSMVIQNTALERESTQLKSAVKGRVKELDVATKTLNQQASTINEQAEQIKKVEALENTITTLRETIQKQAEAITKAQERTERDMADKAKLNTMLTERDAEIVSLGHELAALSSTENSKEVNEEVERLRNELAETTAKQQQAEADLLLLKSAPPDVASGEISERITNLEFRVDTLLEYNDSLVQALQMIGERIKTEPALAEVGQVIEEILADYQEGVNQTKAQ